MLLGGYGLFGRHLARLLNEQDGLEVLIAGRSLSSAHALAEQLSNARGVLCDADANYFPARLRELAPALLVHLAGPFQGQDYRVAMACIEAGVHYIDLADGREFVCGIGALDAAARQAGVLVCSGASSVPALSSAAADHLAKGLASVQQIEIGISPGNRTERGLATVRAILGYCGRSLSTDDGEALVGWKTTQTHHYPSPVGARMLSPCDVPDLTLLPLRYSGRPRVRFGAGLELRLLHRGMNLIAALRRRGWVRDWSRHARPLNFVAGLLRHLGSDAGAMHVKVNGITPDGRPQQRTWQLQALRGDGPFVPTLAAAALVRALASGQMAQRGALPCVGLLTLNQFEREAQGRAISMGEARTLYRQVMGDAFEGLAAAPRHFHNLQGRWTLSGEVRTTPPASGLGRLLAALTGTPRSASTGPIQFELDAAPGRERWHRKFPHQAMQSILSLGPDGLLTERLGAARLGFSLGTMPGGGLRMTLQRMQFLGIPCPRWLMPRVVAEERGEGSRLHFHIRADVPGLGLVAGYDGWLDLENSIECKPT